MIRSALLLCASLLAAICFACVAVTPPPPPVAVALPPLAVASSAQACDPRPFKNIASYLDHAFDPGPTADPPAPNASFPTGSSYLNDLGLAFCAASPEFRQQLLTLDQVYINAAPCPGPSPCFEGSWGWLHQGQRYVAISAGLWNPRLTYSAYETKLQQTVLPTGSGIVYSNAQSCDQSGVCQTVDNFATALLALLAHEMGHIGYYAEVPYSTPSSFCNNEFYKSWVKATVNPPPTWRDLLTPAERDNIRGGPTRKWPYIHQQPPQIDAIDHPGSGSPPPNQLIFQLVANSARNSDGSIRVQGAPWASPFAAMSPDEDFVETYKFKVLTTANLPLTSESIVVPNGVRPGVDGSANIVADYLTGGRQDLATKIGCVSVLF